jgi:hypothetical protein
VLRLFPSPVRVAIVASVLVASCDFPVQLVGDGAFPEHLESSVSAARAAEFIEAFQVEGYLVALPSGARRVYRDSRAWSELWSGLHPDVAGRPVPAVDFSREMVILTTERGESRGEPERLIQSARRNGVMYVVLGREQWDERCAVLLGQPLPSGLAVVHASIVPRHDGTVSFVERRIRGDCFDVFPSGREPPAETTGTLPPMPRP